MTLFCLRSYCRLLPRFLSVLALVLPLAACATSTPQAAAPPMTPLRLQLSWFHNYSSATFYLAENHGHYAAENIEMSFLEGGFRDNVSVDAVEQVMSGAADIGVSRPSSILRARAEGKPVVAFAVLYQQSPLCIIAMPESGIRRPQDLVGRRVAVPAEGVKELYLTMLAVQGIDPDEVETVPRTKPGMLAPLLEGDVDALVSWSLTEGINAREMHEDVTLMMLSDYGVSSYELVMFTTEEMITRRPEVVERFLRATLHGVEDMVNDPAQAAAAVVEHGQDLQADEQLVRIEASLPLINPVGSQPGRMQGHIWEETHAILLEHDILQQPIEVDAAYTTAFLDKIYQ